MVATALRFAQPRLLLNLDIHAAGRDVIGFGARAVFDQPCHILCRYRAIGSSILGAAVIIGGLPGILAVALPAEAKLQTAGIGAQPCILQRALEASRILLKHTEKSGDCRRSRFPEPCRRC